MPQAPAAQGRLVADIGAYRVKTYDRREDIPFAQANAALLEYAESQRQVLYACSGQHVDAPAHIRAFWTLLTSYMPPEGSFYLIWSPQGGVVGTGALRRANETTGEMKHLYVHPSARGAGLGRFLVEQRMRDARAIGLQSVMADTLKGNVEMPALYASLGFEEVARNADAASIKVTDMLEGHMRFFRRDL